VAEDRDLDDLAESVASRESVDWDRAEAGVADAQRRAEVHALRDVERLAEFHHTLQRDAAPAGSEGLGRWGDLMLLERVASGGGSEVYRAWDPALQREVALKLLIARDAAPPEDEAWLEEARTLAKIRDPHVVTVLGAARHQGRAGLWMEFLHGPTLEQEIARQGALPPAEVARLGSQIGRALAAAHAAGVIHRDVKPANIVIEPGGRAVLSDFGLGARRASQRDSRPYSGTPLFMSPQRLAGAAARNTDDLYALGVALRWALTGSPPFQAGSLEQLRVAVARGPERALRVERPDAPAMLASAIDRSMSTEPSARFTEGRELATAFEAAALEAGEAKATSRGARVRFSTLVLATFTLGVVALAAWLAASRTSRPATPRSDHGAPPAPAAAYDVSASFLKRGAHGDRHLESGDRVGPGDRISLEFRSTRPVWVYVINADERGESYLLFPQPLFDRHNPLPAESSLVLPGTRRGHENAWTVTSRGGREHLLVVANPAPVPELEAEVSRLAAPVPNAAVHDTRMGANTMERLRGMGGLSEISNSPPLTDPSRLLERIRSLAGREEGVHGTWVRQVVLENPLR
jgi:serine/threonine protein kinase